MMFFLFVFLRFACYRRKNVHTHYPPVSVIISARNEYQNLGNFLKKILCQDYPDYEVVVVNDHSEDDTSFLLQKLSGEYKHLKVINLVENVNFFRGKKFPLSIGIKSAANDILLFTDADCYPAGNNWIKEMAGNYPKDKEMIVLGYGGYEEQKGFLNKLIRSDTLHTAILFLGFAQTGIPYMGVGRNVLYHRNIFYRAGGFTSHYTLNSGDDDLFINSVAGKSNTIISVSPDAKTSFYEWKMQKKRHLSTASSYRFYHKMLLGLYWFSHFLFFTAFMALILVQYGVLYALSAFLLRLITQLWLTKKSMSHVGEKNLLLFSPLVDVLYLFLNPYLYLASRISRGDKWK